MSLRRGERIERPQDFSVSSSRLTERFSYYLDEEHGYVKAVPARAGDNAPITFYRLISTMPPPRRRTLRRLSLPTKRRSLRYGLVTLGLTGLALIMYPLYPGAAYQVQKEVHTTILHTTALAAAPEKISETNRIVIPKIGVETTILEGPSLDILNTTDGVWHQTGVLQDGNFVLAGHRFKYLPPNTSTLYNLHDLSLGDTIIIDWFKTRYVYVIDSVMTVPSTDTKVLAQTGGPRLTIYTCTNSSQTMRTVVTAHRQN
jgi:LPXTG-site transpeptidase (sortase) family protein